MQRTCSDAAWSRDDDAPDACLLKSSRTRKIREIARHVNREFADALEAGSGAHAIS